MDQSLRRLFISISVCTIYSCGKLSSSELHGGKTLQEKEATLRQLKLDILNKKELPETLETAFAVRSLEIELNRKFTIESVDGRKELQKYFVVKEKDKGDADRFFKTSLAYLAVPTFLAYESLATSANSLRAAQTRKQVLASFLMKYRLGFFSLTFSSGLSVGSSGVLSFRTFVSEKPYLLSEQDRAALRAQITSSGFHEGIADVAKFFRLRSEETRELSNTFVKEVVRVYDRDIVSALKEVAAYDFFLTLEKEINFFKIARQFTPENNQQDYLNRIDFLENVVSGLTELYDTMSETEVTDDDGIQLRLSIFRSYREALSPIEKDSVSDKPKSFDSCRDLIEARLANLEKMLALRNGK